MTIDLGRPSQVDLTQQKQTFSRQDIEGMRALNQPSWDTVTKVSDHVIIVKPPDKRNEDNTDDCKIDQESDQNTLPSCPDLNTSQLVEAMDTD